MGAGAAAARPAAPAAGIGDRPRENRPKRDASASVQVRMLLTCQQWGQTVGGIGDRKKRNAAICDRRRSVGLACPERLSGRPLFICRIARTWVYSPSVDSTGRNRGQEE